MAFTRKLVSVAFACALAATMCPAAALADGEAAETPDAPAEQAQPAEQPAEPAATEPATEPAEPAAVEPTIIVKTTKPAADIRKQVYPVGTKAKAVQLPATVAVTLADETGANKTKADIEVKWAGKDAYDASAAGTYVFAAQLPEGSAYTLAQGVELPTVKVKLVKTETSLAFAAKPKGAAKDAKGRYVITAKATKSVAVKLKATVGNGRKATLYRKVDGAWTAVDKAHVYKLGKKTASKTFAVTLPDEWYAPLKTWWKVEVPADNAYKAASVTFKTEAQRVFQNPSKYFQVLEAVPQRKTTYDLKYGMSGYKVYLLQKRLGIYAGHSKFASITKASVKRFQRRKGLKATGVVDLKTWLKLGFTEKQWYYADAYVSPIQVDATSTKKDCVETFIERARDYLGTRYVWCAAAKPKQGVDCAGLVIQALYASGIDPLPSGSHVYAYSKNEYTTARMWHNKKFKHVSYSSRRRGDIICYYGHVAIALSRSTMIEALPGGGTQISSIRTNNLRGVIRPFV